MEQCGFWGTGWNGLNCAPYTHLNMPNKLAYFSLPINQSLFFFNIRHHPAVPSSAHPPMSSLVPAFPSMRPAHWPVSQLGGLKRWGPHLPWLRPQGSLGVCGWAARTGWCRQDTVPLPLLALLTMPQEVIDGQEGFSRDRFPVLRPWLQAHVDPLTGSPAVKLLIVKYLEENSRCWEQAAHPWWTQVGWACQRVGVPE